jgi:NAD(P)-dependent dehydrogenase (short-subunit alcohol dehydrogenase family)
MSAVFANTPEIQAFVNSLHALKRIARPEEIAQSVLHLASDALRRAADQVVRHCGVIQQPRPRLKNSLHIR